MVLASEYDSAQARIAQLEAALREIACGHTAMGWAVDGQAVARKALGSTAETKGEQSGG